MKKIFRHHQKSKQGGKALKDLLVGAGVEAIPKTQKNKIITFKKNVVKNKF